MKMTINQAVRELQKSGTITKFEKFRDNVRAKTGTVVNDLRLTNEIVKSFNRDGEIILSPLNKSDLIYRSRLVENAKVMVRITPEERQMRKLYVGHRLMPFLNPNHFNSPKLHFEDEYGKPVQIVEDKLQYDDAMKYLMFYNVDLFQEFFQKDSLKLQCLNISVFHPNINYFEITFLNYSSLKFLIKPIPDHEYLKRHFQNRKKDKDLWNGVKKLVNQDEHLYSIDHILLSAYNYFARDNISEPGSPFSHIYNNQKDCTVHSNLYKTFFTSDEKNKKFHDAAFKDLEFGKAKDMEGILREMGLSVTTDFIYLLMIWDLIDIDKIDDEYILEDIIEVSERLTNDQQHKNLEKAYNKLRKKAFDDFLKFDQSTILLAYLENLIDAKKNLLFLIRDVDDLLEIPYENKMKILMPFLELDHMLDSLIFLFARDKKVDTQLQKNMNELIPKLNLMLEKFRRDHDID